MSDEMANLARDLERLWMRSRPAGVFGEEAHEYQVNPPLVEEEAAAFEQTHGVRLPEEYRQFVTRIGNGGAGPFYGLFKLGEMDDGFEHAPWGDFVGDLASPFPHTEAWNDLTGLPEDAGEGELEAWEARMEAFERRYFDAGQVNGAIPICHLGCALRQWLVITGPEAGNVWEDRRSDQEGLRPLPGQGQSRVTFLAWYRQWLDAALVQAGLEVQR